MLVYQFQIDEAVFDHLERLFGLIKLFGTDDDEFFSPPKSKTTTAGSSSR